MTLHDVNSEHTEDNENTGNDQDSSEGIKLVSPDEVGGDAEKALAVNIDKLKPIDDKLIIDCLNELLEVDAQRADLNEEAADIRARIKGVGIPIPAFNAAYARYKVKEDKRVKQDAGYGKCCSAMGVGYQPGLFG